MENIFRLNDQFFKEKQAVSFDFYLCVDINRVSSHVIVCWCTSCPIHVLHFAPMCCSCVFCHQCHASRSQHNAEAENKETITHIRVKNISLVEFSRLDGKIKFPKGTLIGISQIETCRV